ncbi:MAG: trimethylamine methyltransferase family protein [Betaproteobacteria bacterium]|nr:trimethylamine methyltransferase family protein [Betaproteobacteria bacterium]
MTPPLLRAEDCARIHEASLDVLETVGVRVDDAEALALLKRNGATDATGPDTVRLPRGLARDCLSSCPRTARVTDRQDRLREFGPGGPAIFWTGNALYVARDNQREELRTGDLAELTRVADACPEIDGMVGTSVADFPPPARDVVGFREMARNTAKHLRPCIFTPQGASSIVEMGKVLAGGASLRDRPVVSFGYSIVSPLHWTSTGVGVMRNTAGHGLPLMINSEPMGGGTAPVTLAGCLVLANADTLSGIVIAQLLERGRPVIYNVGFAHVLDMATGVALTGAPENALLQSAGADLARFHNMPSASWMSTESMIPDAQAAAETMMTGLAHAAWGVNVVWGAGNLESTLCMSAEKLVIDDELIGSIRRFVRGIPVNDETLALDVIRELGHRADFLSHEHTLAHFQEEIRHSPLMLRSKRDAWARNGSRDMSERAAERVREILSRAHEPHVSPEQERELTRIVDHHLASIGAGG